jgi:drug/metabolite transporter (DMT)-like permease
MHHVMFVAISLMWGSSFILMKIAAVAFGPITIAGLRVAGGAAFLGVLWWVWRRREAWPLKWGDAPGLAVIVVIGCCWPFAMQPYLIHRYSDSAFFGMMVALVPLITIALSIPMLGVKPTARQLIGVACGLVCLALLMNVGVQRDMSWVDLLYAVSVPLAYATSNTFVKRRFTSVSSLPLTLSALTWCALMMVPAGIAVEPIHHEQNQLLLAVPAILVLGLLGSGLAWYLFFVLIRERGPLFAGMVTYIIPIVALGWGAVDGERIGTLQLLALLGVLLCTALVQARPRGASQEMAKSN